MPFTANQERFFHAKGIKHSHDYLTQKQKTQANATWKKLVKLVGEKKAKRMLREEINRRIKAGNSEYIIA